ncbi:MAG: LON peptidase substrate-binding domain-containing protein [Candidatus Eremiobacteraeota bacterium]|nr:LON peptidase substrate-binding domain-containing protein [Candidatus Eremiobacteraeota bacterium]
MQFDRILSQFSGELPLFPLPKVVLFPGARLPLHIFEPRYRQMISDAEENEGLIGMVCLRERRSKSDTGNSPVHSVACLSQIRNLQRLPDGRFLMQLQGIQRARIREELDVPKPYRIARVDLVPDIVNPLEPTPIENLFERALDSFNQVLRNLADLPGSLVSIQKEAPAGLLLDVLAYYLPVDSLIKQRLLEESEVHQRARLLSRILDELAQVVPDDDTVRFRIFPKPSWN